MSIDSAAAALIDVVVFAGGDSVDLMPLSAVESKTMLRVCNRPLIWYCIAPWIEAGFSTFFLCVNEDYATLRSYLSRAFDGVVFYFVLVPSNVGDHASTTCDAVKAYLKYKEALRMGDDAEDTAAAAVVDGDDGDGALCVDGDGDAPMQRRVPRASRHSCNDAVKRERLSMAGLPRDAMLLSCDTILAGVDVTHFVEKHYASMASLSAIMFRPHRKRAGTNAAANAAGKKKKKPVADMPVAESLATFTHSFTCVAYEEEDVTDAMAVGSPASAVASHHHHHHQNANNHRYYPSLGSSFNLSSDGHRISACGAGGAMTEPQHIQHRRVHYVYPLEGKPEVRVTMAFAARRPNMTLAADVVDAHAYLVQRWVLDFIAESAGIPDVTVRKYILPLLARSQHSAINTAEGVLSLPADKLKHTIPPSWTGDGAEVSVQSLSAAHGATLPEVADSLRVFCSIYTESPDAPCRIYRLNTRDNYQALNHELITAKAHLQQQEDLHQVNRITAGPPSVQLSLQQQQQQQQQHSGGRQHNSSLAETCPTPNTLALALLLPDNPISIREKMGSQQVHIVSSFMDSVPPPNVFITRSVIGPNVLLEPGVRITDSVLMGNVEVGAKAVITHSVIGTGAIVNAEHKVVNSTVGPRCVVDEDVYDRIVE